MTLTMKLAGVVTGLGLALSVAGQAHATDLTFYYPVAVGGPVTKVIDGMAADFEQANPDIHIQPVYAGSYQDTIAKTLTAPEGGEAPQGAAIMSTDMSAGKRSVRKE